MSKNTINNVVHHPKGRKLAVAYRDCNAERRIILHHRFFPLTNFLICNVVTIVIYYKKLFHVTRYTFWCTPMRVTASVLSSSHINQIAHDLDVKQISITTYTHSHIFEN